MYKIEHMVQVLNDPNSTDPPEYIIRGATSFPVISKRRPLCREELNIDDRRQALKLFNLKDFTLDTFYSLLFSNEAFFLDSFDKSYLLELVKGAVLESGLSDLMVYLNFQIEPDGTFLLVDKFFYASNRYPYVFENGLSSTLSVKLSKKPGLSYDDISDGSANLVTYKETFYRFHERLYVTVNINHPEERHILPLVIAYDEFGVVYADFFYGNKIISKEILSSIKPEFDESVSDFDYFSQDEIEAFKMLLI